MKRVEIGPRPQAEQEEEFSPFFWREGAFHLLDQTLLPERETWLRCERPEEVAEAIRRLAVRGAPAIGVAAAPRPAPGMSGVPQPGQPPPRPAPRSVALRATPPA